MISAELVRQVLLILFNSGMCFAFLDRKYELKKTLLVYGSATAAIIALNMPISILLGIQTYTALYPITTNTTFLIVLLFLSKRKGFPVIFNVLTTICLACITTISANYIIRETGWSDWMEILIRIIISIPLAIIVYRYIRPSYLKMLTVMKKGWGYLCLIPFLFYILGLFIALNLSPEPEEYRKEYLYCFLALCIVVVAYGVIFALFTKTLRESEMQDEQQLLKIQMQAMEQHAGLLKENEEKQRIYRHDLRHYIANVKVLLESGNTQEALRVLGVFDEQNKNTSVPHYCSNSTVNAILVYYIQKAELEGITVTINCGLSGQLPAEAAELATMLANAIENAIRACKKMPGEQAPFIQIKLVSSFAQLALEVVNPYTGTISFDENGLPVSTETGHGLGTRSISAFVKKHDGYIKYSAEDNLFRLRLLIGT